MKRVVVVGGGISGLAAAWEAAERASTDGLDVLVLERDDAVGGKARSLADDGWLVEAGPTAYQEGEPAVDALIRGAGLTPLPADDASARRFIVGRGRMREVFAHPLKFARSGLLSPSGMVRVALEPLIPAKRDGADETVWDFARRRIGREAADRLIAPMVLGVFAGNAKKISLPAVFPKLTALEAEHGSLIRGMIAKRRRGNRKAADAAAGSASRLVSFRDGLQSLPLALARREAFAVRCATPVESLESRGGGWRLRAGGEPIDADAVVLAGEPWAMAPLLRGVEPRVAELLGGIECPPVTVVALGFSGEAARRIPRGFGVLVARGEGYRMLGCLWDSHLFPGRSPAGRILVRVMVGGAVDPEAARLPDGELTSLVREELSRMMGVRGEPEYRRIVRWPRAIPQYGLGHLTRAAEIDHRLAARPGLFLGGNALGGISFGKAAEAGRRAGAAAAAYLRAGRRGVGVPAGD